MIGGGKVRLLGFAVGEGDDPVLEGLFEERVEGDGEIDVEVADGGELLEWLGSGPGLFRDEFADGFAEFGGVFFGLGQGVVEGGSVGLEDGG